MNGKTTPNIKDLPIGIDASGTREEFDSMGTVKVPADRYWGAQTQRSLAARIAEGALANDQTLREAALASGEVDEETFDRVVDPQEMVGHGVAGA